MNRMETMHLATPSEKEIVVTRVFNAPRQLVFDAFTKPELLNVGSSDRGIGLSKSAKST